MTRTPRSLFARTLKHPRTRGGRAHRHERKTCLQFQTLEDRVTPVTVTITPLADAIEGGTAKFLLSRDNSSGSLTVHLEQTGTFQSLLDTPAPDQIFDPGQTTKEVTVETQTDSLFEGPETIIMEITPGSYTIGTPNKAAVTVVDLNAPLDAPADECGCGGGPANMAQADIGIAGAAGSADGVRYADGSVSVSATDLSSGGFGQSTGVYRGWTNAIGYDAAGFDGGGVISGQLPYLRTDGSKVLAATGGISSTIFDKPGSSYVPRHMLKDTLTENTGSKEFTLVTSAGAKLVFNNFDGMLPAFQKGQIKTITDPEGNVTTVTSRTADGKPLEIQRTSTVGGTTTTESFLYAYITTQGDPNLGKLSSVTLQRTVGAGSPVVVRKSEYSYYTGSEPTGSDHGRAGDLKLVVVKDGATPANILDQRYYRYRKTADSTGYAGSLKYAVTGDSYERLIAADSTPEDAPDTLVASMADDYLEFDSVQRVTKHTVQGTGCTSCAGGLGTSTFTYTTSIFAEPMSPPNYNLWWMKTVETRADNNTMTVYTNFAGQPMLEVYKDTTTGQQWITYHQYDSAGREVMLAHPSAVSGYSEAYSDLVHFVSGHDYQYLNNSTGLIETTSYGASTTATPSIAGNVTGYVYQTAVQRGDGGAGTPQTALQSTTQYFSRSDNPVTVTVYPVATVTRYRTASPAGADPQTTSYAYTYFTDTIQPQQVTTTLPTVTTTQNGPNAPTSTTKVFDDQGRAIWSKDQDGFISRTVYDNVTGGITQTIADVNTALTTDEPAGWTTPAGGGLHLITSYELDDQGRATKITAPNGNITYTVYKDAAHEVRTYAWDTDANTRVGQTTTTVSREDRDLGYTETLTMSATPSQTGGRPDGTEAISGVQTLSREVRNTAQQVVCRDEYFNLSGVTYSADSVTLGTAGTNYNRTQLSYGKLGDLERTQTPSGTIYRTVYDGQRRAVSTWVGTDDNDGAWSPTNRTGTNLEQVSASVYDDMNGDGDGVDLGDVGDGNLSHRFLYPSSGDAPADARRTDYFYDWRDRLVATKSGVEGSEGTAVNRPIVFTDLGNLGHATQTRQYDGDGVTLVDTTPADGVPDAPAANKLRGQSKAYFDELGRVYLTEQYGVDPVTFTVSTNSLKTNSWFDNRGQLVKTSQPGGLVTKTAYNGVGWTTATYVSDGGGDASWADALNVTGDTVLEQEETTYDANGNVLVSTTRQRFHNATGTGVLGTPTVGVLARVSFTGYWYDKGDRLVASADVGTNAGSAWTRPIATPTNSDRSDTFLLTEIGYDSAGRRYQTIDPKNIKSQLSFDLLGRVTQSIENYDDGTVGDTDDKTTQFEYGPAGQTKIRVRLTGGGEQTTETVYGVSQPGDKFDSLDAVKKTKYPDPSSGLPSASEAETVTRNALGEVLTSSDRNGNTHTFTYDVVGRLTKDAVTTLGTGVNGSIRRIETAYDGQGNPYLITSYTTSGGSTVVNQVKRDFNGLGQLTSEWQAHGGAVTGSTVRTQYAYSWNPTGSNNDSRPTGMTYPAGKDISYTYNTGLDANISRLSSLGVNSTVVESYTYLGLGTTVERIHSTPAADLTYIKQGTEPNGDAGDQYTGLDRFGRVVDQRWRKTSDNSNLDRYQYTYDRDGNRTARANLVNSSFNETYTYDGLNQLATFAVTGTTKSWDYDAVGNWDGVTTNAVTESRTHNKQNELLTATGQTSPTYDANGNQKKDFGNLNYTYDAWNRVITASTRTYEYDGLGRRIQQTTGATVVGYYHSASWQTLEDRVNGVLRAHYVWSPGYVDAMILRDYDNDGNGTVEERLWVTQDANYNVTGLIDDTGAVQERYTYDPYGTRTIYDASYSVRGTSSYTWLYNHQGLRLDTVTGKYHARNRDYDPAAGRWMQMDPIAFDAGDTNLYRTVRNNVPNLLDPNGTLEVTYQFGSWIYDKDRSGDTYYGAMAAEVDLELDKEKWTIKLLGTRGPLIKQWKDTRLKESSNAGLIKPGMALGFFDSHLEKRKCNGEEKLCYAVYWILSVSGARSGRASITAIMSICPDDSTSAPRVIKGNWGRNSPASIDLTRFKSADIYFTGYHLSRREKGEAKFAPPTYGTKPEPGP